jgi:MoaA/NifB/PqqE/SkfB family radical SAM enzyme
MSDDLFRKVIDEVLTFPFIQKINPYLFNDPLVDKKLPDKLAYIAQKKGKRRRPHVRMTTNAGLLTDEMGSQLLHSEGLDEINFSFHSIQPDVYEAMMPPLKYDRVMGNILRFKALWDRYPGKKPRLKIWTVRTQPVIDNLPREKAYWKKVGIGLLARKLDNRADSKIELLQLGEGEYTAVPFCVIPYWRAYVMWNGDMVMCCVDQERSNLLGNCTEHSIRDIWQNAAYQELRQRWRSKQLQGLLCENCKGT